MPAVSVIVPVYKVEPYAARCARSLFGQTIEDIEYIFVDDCSPDRSIEIVKEVLADYPDRKEQVRFVRTPRNGGLARARVFGLKFATGDYIIHCDSDDAVMPDAYRLMYEKAVAEDLDIVTCDFQALIGDKVAWVQPQYSAPGNEIADLLTMKAWPTVWCRLTRRSLWDDIKVPRADLGEDVVFTIQTIAKADRIGFIPDPLYQYYMRLGSISMSHGKLSSIRRWYGLVANVRQVMGLLSDITPVSWKPSDVIILKYRCRWPLKDYVQIPQFYRRWRNTFPEVNGAILLNNFDHQEKIDYCLIRLHLYYPWKRSCQIWKKSYRSVRRFLRIIYYRVFCNCTPPVGKPKQAF